jgi:hypothetical protein
MSGGPRTVTSLRRRLRLPALAFLILASAGFRHDVHVSNARVALESQAAYIRVRLFRRDFEQALRAHAGQADFRLVVNPRADSVVTSYVTRHLVLQSSGRPLSVTLVGSGEEPGLKPELDIWWVDFRYDAAAPIGRLEITNELLFERFRDQQNIMKIHLPNGAEKTVTFVPGEATYRLEL